MSVLLDIDLTDVAAVKKTWAEAFHQAEGSLTADGYTCDELAPGGKSCIACQMSIRLRKLLFGDEYE